jgi:cytochrome oxidase Cu insertion factor (SCO1/SenC/PrrC family)
VVASQRIYPQPSRLPSCAVQSHPVRSLGRTSLLLLFLLSALATSSQVLPKPQITSAEGKPAPNFILKDENGKAFRLASLRGQRVLLLFYRGYW